MQTRITDRVRSRSPSGRLSGWIARLCTVFVIASVLNAMPSDALAADPRGPAFRSYPPSRDQVVEPIIGAVIFGTLVCGISMILQRT